MKFPKQYTQLLSTMVTDVTAIFTQSIKTNKVIILRLPFLFNFFYYLNSK